MYKQPPFIFEKKRQKLARERKLKELLDLYKPGIPGIPNKNTSKFWDSIFTNKAGLDFQDGMTKDRVKTVRKFLPKGKIRLLDIGAGLGYLEELIQSEKNIEIYANDFSRTSIEYLKKNFSGHFIQRSIFKLNYKQKFFDAIVLLEVLEHIDPDKVFGILKKVNKYLKPEGILVVSVPMNEGLESMNDNPNGHVRMYTPELIKTELEVAGFNIISSKQLYAFKNFYYIKKILAIFLRNKWQPNNIVLMSAKK